MIKQEIDRIDCQRDHLRKRGITSDQQSTHGNFSDTDADNLTNLMLGSKHQSETSFQKPGSMLALRHKFNSGDSDSYCALGQSCCHTFSITLKDMGNGFRQIVDGDDSRINFCPGEE